MSANTRQDLQGFYQFLGSRLASGSASEALEDLLDEWRASHPGVAELSESVAAVREALADMDAGDVGRPADEVLREIEQRLQTRRQ